MRVLYDDDPRTGDVRADPRALRRPQLLAAEDAGGRVEPPHHQPRVERRPAELRDQHVRGRLRIELVAGTAKQMQRDLVRHRRGREEDRLLLAEQLRAAPLQLVDGRIFALLLVPNLGRGDRGAHARGRLRDGVGAKVDAHPDTLDMWTWIS